MGGVSEFWLNPPCTRHKDVSARVSLKHLWITRVGGIFSPSLSVSHRDNGAKGVYGGACVFGPAHKHPSELSSWQFVRNGGALKTITPHCAALQVFYYFNDRQQIAREQTQASLLYTHVDTRRQPLFAQIYGVFSPARLYSVLNLEQRVTLCQDICE